MTTITYGKDLAWVGMMLVAPQYRGRGIGKQLMRTALNYCQRSRIATVKLDATHAGRPLYESLGFVPESGVERWQGNGLSDAQRTPPSFCNDELCLALYKLDEQAFYTSRRELIRPARCWATRWPGAALAHLERGFAKQRDLTRMCLGRKTTGASDLVFAIAGPELG